MEWLTNRIPRGEEVLTLARQAVEMLPDNAKAWQGLVELLLAENAVPDAAAVLRTALERFPLAVDLHVLAARAARAGHDTSTARASSARALALSPGAPHVLVERFEVMVEANEWTEVEGMLDVIGGQPISDRACAYVSECLLRAGRVHDSLSFWRRIVDARPHSTRAVHALGLALALAGLHEEARVLIDPDRFTYRVRLPVPDGFGTFQDFQARLIAEIEQNPSLTFELPEKATRDGFQTSRLLLPDRQPAVEALLATIRETVLAHANSFPPTGDHVFLRSRPSRARLQAWAVVYPEQGRQESHIHPSGWLSGVYYVAMPSHATARPDAGALVLEGIADGTASGGAASGTRTLVPAVGDLMLFPSWLPHSTIPTGSSERRISVSFDVIPDRD